MSMGEKAQDIIDGIQSVDDLHPALVAALRAAHAEGAREMRKWQPIETAPKDGTWVDLWTTYGSRLTARWVDETRDVPSPDCVMDGWKDRRHDHYGCFNESKITHWMPLPAPPYEAKP